MANIKVCTNEYCGFVHHECNSTEECLVCGFKLKSIRESTFNAMYAESPLQINAKNKQIINPFSIKTHESLV